MNDISFLHPDFKQKLDQLKQACMEKDIQFKITDAIRVESEQNYKYAKGRTNKGQICTIGQYPNNYHCWGLAVDIETDNQYEEIAKIADILGIRWGGNNKEFQNIQHFEYPMETLKFLRLTYGSYKNFRLTWDKNYMESSSSNCIITEPLLVSANKNDKYIKDIQTACNMDGFRTADRRILTISGTLDEPTLQVLSRVKFIEDKRYSLIKKIQILLSKIGYSIVITGKYDKDTKNTVIRFQRAQGLNPNGIPSKDVIILILSKI